MYRGTGQLETGRHETELLMTFRLAGEPPPRRKLSNHGLCICQLCLVRSGSSSHPVLLFESNLPHDLDDHYDFNNNR